MTVCASVKTLVRRHEWIGDLFSVLAVALLFATVWAALQYYDPLWNWIVHNNPLIAMPVVVAAAVLDVALTRRELRRVDGHERNRGDDACRGRRHGGSPSLGSAFGHWVKHMERVGKVHR